MPAGVVPGVLAAVVRVLVTGAAGYVGSVVAIRLAAAGHEAVPWDLAGGRDVRDPVPLARALHGAGAVVHCAARTLVAESYADPGAYWVHNLGGTVTLLNAMRTARVRTVVFSSTAAVYGDPETVPVTEDHPARPVTPYGASKLACDTLLAEYARLYGFAAVSLRYFNVAGAHRHGRTWAGERHDPETHLIPNVLAAARDGTPALVCGVGWPTPDGTCIRDYVHVTDLADAHLLALGAARPGEHLTCNLGSGTGFSVREVLAMCRRVTGQRIEEKTASRRPGDPAVLVASPARAAAALGWVPRRGLHQMVASAWAHTLQEASRKARDDG